jgi:formylglycine-generating enzyme required for sulfatase activity
MPESPKQLKVFLCHSSADKPVVRELYQRLSAESWVDVWLDEEKLFPGQDWNLEIEKAVEAAHAILVCLSNNSITKEGYVQRELRIVLDYADYKPEGTLYLIPVRLEACDPPRRLRPWHYADYFPVEGRARAYERLLVSLRMRAAGLGISIGQPAADERAPAAQQKSPEHRDVRSEELVAKPAEEAFAVGMPVSRSAKQPVRLLEAGRVLTLAGIDFVKIPAGKFLMGSKNDDKEAYGDEKPQHSLEIAYDYWLARFPLTNKQYNAFVQSSSGRHPVSGWEQKKDHPLVNVSWTDAQVYVKWLNEEHAGGLPKGYVYRLPTEAEWEKAARGPYGNIYPWGNEFDQNKCNSAEGGKVGTTAVGAYSPVGDSSYGCADMSGNVWEWIHSIFEKYPYKVDDGREDEKKTGDRVLRGGSFYGFRRSLRCTYRRGLNTGYRYYLIGFRVSLVPSSGLWSGRVDDNGLWSG